MPKRPTPKRPTGKILALLAAVLWTGPAVAADPIPVQAAAVERATIPDIESATGMLAAWKEIDVAPGTSGNVTEVPVSSLDTVRKGDVLFQLDDRIAEADLARAQARLTVTEGALARSQDLAQRGNVSRSQLDSAQADFAEAKANLASAHATLDTLTLRAPFDGILGIVTIAPGAYVQAGEKLTELEDESRLYVDFHVRQGLLPRLEPGLPFTVTSDALGNRTAEGKVALVVPQGTKEARSIWVRGIIENSDGTLTDGIAVRVDMRLGSHGKVLSVPVAALIPTMTGNYVYRVADGKAQWTAVEVGARDPRRAEIRSGLAEGDRVVTVGQFRLKDGTPVRVTGEDS